MNAVMSYRGFNPLALFGGPLFLCGHLIGLVGLTLLFLRKSLGKVLAVSGEFGALVGLALIVGPSELPSVFSLFEILLLALTSFVGGGIVVMSLFCTEIYIQKKQNA
jgi:hypothetical protein